MTDAAADTGPIVMERLMPHAQDKVWRALTQPALIEDWLMKTDFEPRAGRAFTFRTDPMPQWNGVVDCKVLEIQPMSRLAYSWDVGPAEGGLRTIVTWTLTPAEGGVLVRMEHSGFKADQQHNRQGAMYGWRRFVDGLERVAAGA